MKILILSDTHGIFDDKLIDKIKLRGPYDMLIHAGDLYDDAIYLSNKLSINTYINVCGNCDMRSYPIEEIIDLYNKKIYICHGHKFYVKQEMQLLKREAKNQNCDIVIYGHTHIAHYEIDDNITYINPGSLSIPLTSSPTYGVLDINAEKISYNLYEL